MFDSRKLYRRILAPVALLLILNVGAFAWIVWRHLNEDVAENLQSYAGSLDRMLVTILKGSMRRDDRDTLRSAIRDFGDLEWVRSARILDKHGEVKFSSHAHEVGTRISIASETCRYCHRRNPVPFTAMSVSEVERDSSVLRAAETIVAGQSCSPCHKVEIGSPLGVLEIDLDMEPLAHDVRDRARRNLLLLVFGSLLLLGILIYLVRTLVVGRIHSLSDAVASLRAGQRIQAPESPGDELDDLKETLAALGADLEARQFGAAMLRRAERTLVGHGTPVLLVDDEGSILIANDEAQAELGASLTELVGKSYASLDDGRAESWLAVQQVTIVLHPRAREDRGPEGADRALAALFDPEGKVIGYLEVGRRVAHEPPEEQEASEADAAQPPPAAHPMLPERFLHGPYGVSDETADHVLRGALLMASLTRTSLKKEGILELDPALANIVRTFDRLVSFRETIDDQIDRCDMEHIVRATANDFRRARPGGARWHLLASAPTLMVGHPVLLRQLVTLALEHMLEPKPRDVVVFVQRQTKSPRFFFGIWISSAEAHTRHGVRWRACVDLVRRFNGEIEVDPAYDLTELGRVYGGKLPKLGRGTLLLTEFPNTPA